MASNDHDPQDKGKARSLPMPIPTAIVMHDHFGMSSPSSYHIPGSPASSAAAFSPSSSSAFSSPGAFEGRYIHRSLSGESIDASSSDIGFSSSPSSGKGKQRETIPILPPLTFPDMELDCERAFVSTSAPALDSVGTASSMMAPSMADDHIRNESGAQLSQQGPAAHPANTPVTRRRSLSTLSSAPPSNISRQRILDHVDTHNDSLILDSSQILSWLSTDSASPRSIPTNDGLEFGSASQQPWFTVPKQATIDPSIPLTVGVPCVSPPIPPHVKSHVLHPLHKGKIRSNSSPYPISALDYVPLNSTDIFQPLHIVIPNYFDIHLPRELRLYILRCLVEIHEAEHHAAVRDGRLTLAKATSSRNRWVGQDKGIKELFKLSRVSKGWQSLVLDGQLWAELDLHSFHTLPPHIVARLVQNAGPFAQRLNLAGHARILPDHLTEMTTDMCLATPNAEMPYTQLTSINLQGCIGLSTRSLHHLLVRSTWLEKLVVKGLKSVTNTTCDILSNFCPRLTSLNMDSCPNLNAEGLRSMALAALDRREYLPLKELRLCGLKYVTDATMAALGAAAPHLEVLDLRYARQLHNSAIDAFISAEGPLATRSARLIDTLDPDSDTTPTTISLHPWDLGRETTADGVKFKRRITKLRHLSLSYCVLLTDTACSNLAHSVPLLEFLELGGIGAQMKDAGLVRLLSTTPNIRRLDLEDAMEITDAVLAAITPVPPSQQEDEEEEEEAEVAPSSPPGLLDVTGWTWSTPLAMTPSMSTSSNGSSTITSLSSVSASTTAPVTPTAPSPPPKQPGHALEHLIVSYASRLTDTALLNLIHNCPKLVHLEADNTRIGASVIREFVHTVRQRKAVNAKLVAMDCRTVPESLVKELGQQQQATRPRMGWRAYGAKKLHYLDARDDNEDELRVGQDECDETRVVLKSFYSWQTVDAVRAVREKRRKGMARRMGSDWSTSEDQQVGGSGSASGVDGGSPVFGRSNSGGRWWSPGGRRPGGSSRTNGSASPPILSDINDGCRTM